MNKEITDPYFDTDICVERLLREWRIHKKLIVAVDYDDTIFDYHDMGYKYHGVTNILKECQNLGFYICIFTGCGLEKYELMKKTLADIGVIITSINQNPFPMPFGNHGKMYFNILLDDRAGAGQAYEILRRTIDIIKLESNNK